MHAKAKGDDAGAASRFADALATARQLEEDTGAGVALAGLANVAVALGDLHAAARWLNEPEADPADDAARAVATRAALLRARAAFADAGGDHRQAELLHVEALRLRQLLGDNRAIVEQLEAVATTAAGQERRGRAATLLAAADRWRNAMGLPVPPRDRQAVTDAARPPATGDSALDTAWRTGQELGLDEAVTLALDTADDSK